MCGIFCCIRYLKNTESVNTESDEWKICKERISSRGPDNLLEKCVSLSDDFSGYFAASVLWTQGSKLTVQPAIDEDGNILLWNGDIFSGNLIETNNESDTLIILKAFKSSDIKSTLQKIRGPYSFIYFQKLSKLLHFGRDPLGRHSLLINFNQVDNCLTLTSVTSRKFKNTIELPAIGVFVMELSKDLNFTCLPWRKPNDIFKDSLQKLENLHNIDIKIGNVLFPNREKSFDPSSPDLKYFHDDTLDFRNFENVMDSLLERREIYEKVEILESLLNASVKARIKKQPSFCRNCIKLFIKGEKIQCCHTKIAILFSGGLDSSVLSAIADRFVNEGENIDLINVAFEKAKTNSKNFKNEGEMYNVPDRKTGRQSYSELESICPNRNWNFIEVNISQEELNVYRTCHISDLVYPLATILDESLGCALWFASRGIGFLNGEIYDSPSRILLLGMGADELFGGYMRHRTMLKHKGWEVLTQELKLELNRISERNLGRDDRVTSDHGKQARYPYLDEDLVDYIQSLPPWERCSPTDEMPCGLGDKLLLRLVARKLNLKNAANFPKRAFQFGSRIANRRENGKDLSNRL